MRAREGGGAVRRAVRGRRGWDRKAPSRGHRLRGRGPIKEEAPSSLLPQKPLRDRAVPTAGSRHSPWAVGIDLHCGDHGSPKCLDDMVPRGLRHRSLDLQVVTEPCLHPVLLRAGWAAPPPLPLCYPEPVVGLTDRVRWPRPAGAPGAEGAGALHQASDLGLLSGKERLRCWGCALRARAGGTGRWPSSGRSGRWRVEEGAELGARRKAPGPMPSTLEEARGRRAKQRLCCRAGPRTRSPCTGQCRGVHRLGGRAGGALGG